MPAAQASAARPLTVLLTGGAGFLGRAVLFELLGSADPVLPLAELRVLDRRALPDDPRDRRLAALDRTRLRAIVSDLRDEHALAAALRGTDLVLHCAALVDWGREPAALLHEVNVAGTARLLRLAAQAGVRALVHTSTLDVVYSGQPIRDGDESLPYPARYASAYCASKAAAEQLALRADGQGGLRTAVIRPCCIWGEADPFHIGSLLGLAQRGRLVRVGDGRGRCQGVYVGNCAHALLLAGRALLAEQRPAAAGQVYFATDFAACNFFDQFAPVIEAAGYRMPPAPGLPRLPLRLLGHAAELLGALGRPFGLPQPTLSRFAVDFVCLELTFSGERARRELGYAPRYSEAEAMQRTLDYFRAQRAAA